MCKIVSLIGLNRCVCAHMHAHMCTAIIANNYLRKKLNLRVSREGHKRLRAGRGTSMNDTKQY